MSKHYTVIDFETYYDHDYSLRKMTPVEYIMDPRFECIGASVLVGDTGKAFFSEEKELTAYLSTLDSKKSVFVSHNALFDMCILAWRFGFIPALMIDTMSMARALLYHKTGGVALARIARELNLPAKTNTIHQVTGMGKAAIKASGLWEAYVEYANNDADICRQIFVELRRDFPKEEYKINDMVIRCAALPRFKLDATILAEHLNDVVTTKENLLAEAGMTTRDELLSNEKFAVALRRFGVEPPMKISLTTGKETYAFAKTDQAMADLEEHDDPRVQALVAARLGIKSTQEETRSKRFLNIAMLDWSQSKTRKGTGWMPIPLRYSGAHTHRLSGDWSMNLQNLPRGGKLRYSLTAPSKTVVVACDSSQIEARVVAWLAGQDDLIEAFRQGRDVYSEFASEVFGKPINKKENPDERFVGKTSILGLGYGMGGPKFDLTISTQSRLQLGKQIDLGMMEASRVVGVYRNKYRHISELWTKASSMLPVMFSESADVVFGPCRVQYQSVLLPNGLRLRYHNLRQVQGEKGPEWVYDFAGRPKRVYGGKLVENIVQALARIVVMRAAARMLGKYPTTPLALQVHDELIYIVPEVMAQEFASVLHEEMCREQEPFLGLPLAAEYKIGKSYGATK